MPPKKKEVSGPLNFYKELPKNFVPKYNNPHAERLKIKHPMLAGIYGGSGSMKTNTLMWLLREMSGTWEKLVVCVKTAEEPFYKYLRQKLDPEQLEIYENGEVPPVSKYASCGQQICIIFDDLLAMKNQAPIEEWFIRGRKACNGKGASMVYIAQSYFKTNKLIRLQQNYIFLKRLASSRDLNLVVNDFSMLGEKKKIINAYKKCVDECKENFFLVRVESPVGERFSCNFLDFYDFES